MDANVKSMVVRWGTIDLEFQENMESVGTEKRLYIQTEVQGLSPSSGPVVQTYASIQNVDSPGALESFTCTANYDSSNTASPDNTIKNYYGS